MSFPSDHGQPAGQRRWWQRLFGKGPADTATGGRADLIRFSAQLPGTVLFEVVGHPGRRGRIVFVGDAVLAVNGLQPDDLRADAGIWFAQVLREDRVALRKALARSLANLLPLRIDLRIRRADGAVRWMHLAATPQALPDGQILWTGVQSDVTQQREDMLDGHEAEVRWTNVLRHLPGGITRFDSSLRIRFINEEHARWYGRSVADLLGQTLEDILPAKRYARIGPQLQRALAGHKVVFDNLVEVAAGDLRHRFNTLMPEHGPDGQVTGVISFVLDLTESKRTEQALAEKQAELRGLFEAIPDMVFAKDENGAYRACNRAFEAFFGVTEEDLRGQTDADRYDQDTASRYRAEDLSAMQTGRAYRSEEVLRGIGGNGDFDVIKTPVRDAAGRISGVVGVARDVTERKRAAQQIERLAYYDSLTALPNRRMLVSRLENALRTSKLSLEWGAVLFVDLDNFRDFNDILGHDMGDRLLQLAAERLRGMAVGARTAARFSGDGFVLVAEHLGTEESQAIRSAEQLGQQVLDAIAKPFSIGGRQHHGTASVGITTFGAGSLSVDDILKRADLAMHQSKTLGRNTLCFFDPRMQAAVQNRATLEADLRAGLAREELELHYQPVVDSAGRMTGAEALVRWRHPVRGMVPPLDFITIAEESGLILPLGGWVLGTACRQLVAWADRPQTRDLSIAVNVSARQFRHPDFIDQVVAVLRETGVDARKLKFELTESLLFHDVEGIIGKMARLREEGIGFSLDDFGTGYSSLSYLKRMPLEQLKIDRSFVRDLLTDPHDAAIVRTTLALALSLDLDVIAEGVESEGQRDFLEQHGCRSFQGYLFGRPLPIAEMERQQGLVG
ncbi:EAL domain-containing protein [uncultured Xylophilus sp.]|uniref:bifunctional diguanylate cyclase/phosphodiesterase n=1 Tax=uncultured Xylophilus sp. TaxID=296832 RepID=UPI0025DAEB2E|nr:EAL domain-containing protein [uncultured Xylophilus sp.]